MRPIRNLKGVNPSADIGESFGKSNAQIGSEFDRGKQILLMIKATAKKAYRMLVRIAPVGREEMLFFRARLKSIALRRIEYVGITGSAGKTTTRDLTVSILAAKGKCFKGLGNKPAETAKSILKMNRSMRYSVLEVSGGAPGRMDWPLRLFRPKIAVLTLIGRDHYKAFGSLKGIAAEKRRLIDALPKDGIAVLNIDDPFVREIGESCRCQKIWVGRHKDATIQLLDARSDWTSPLVMKVKYGGKRFAVPTRLYGSHLALSVLCALGVGIAAGVRLATAIGAIERVRPPDGRMQVVESEDGITFIRDDWKAPDWSLDAALEFLKHARVTRRVAVIGTVSDFSRDSSKKYRQIARRVMECADLAVFVGPNAYRAMRARNDENKDRIVGFPTISDAAKYFRGNLRDGDMVLLKGSNKADHLVRLFLDRFNRVQCWESRCGLVRFCDQCSRLYEPPSENIKFNFDTEETGEKYTWPEWMEESKAHQCRTFLFVGLGNPSEKLQFTPHNLGRDALDVFAKNRELAWERAPAGWVTQWKPSDRISIVLFKPEVKMNKSGLPVNSLLKKLGVGASRCIVAHDDMDLSFGTIRKKRDGSDGGHKGLGSIVSTLKSDRIYRIRIGCRTDGGSAKAKDRVLDGFRRTERLELPKFFTQVDEELMHTIDEVVSRSK